MDIRLNCVIVDDDQHAIDLIAQLANKHPYLNVVKTFTNPLQALAGIVGGIDLLFLDIDMPGMNGLELAALLRPKVTYLIFVTAHAQFALSAYQVAADQYLIKPISETDFFKAISLLRIGTDKTESDPVKPHDDSLYVKQSLKSHYSRIERADIICVETVKGTNYVAFVTTNRRYKTNLTMRLLEDEFNGDTRFMRISRSTLIRLGAIVDIKGNTLVLENSENVVVGDEYKKKFMDYVRSKLSNG